MRKLFYLFGSMMISANLLTACEEDLPTNPGDSNLRPTLEISEVITSLSGGEY